MDNAARHWESRIGRRLKLRDLEILFAVVHWGSMAKAAQHLAMTQPAVSKVVGNLESALHVRLLDRSPRGIEPTVFAQALLKRGNVVFDELSQGIRDIEFLADSRVGEVRIAAGATLTAGLLPAVIDQLSRRYPQIVVHLFHADAALEFRELRERQVDLLLTRVTGAPMEDDLDAEMLFADPHRVVVGTKSRWARRRKVGLAQLVNEPWTFSPHPAVSTLVADAFRAQGLAVPRGRINTASILLRNHLLASGRFLTVLPASVLRHHEKQWGLKTLPIDLAVTPRHVAMVTLKRRTVSPVVQLFIEQVRVVAKMMFSAAGSK